MRLKTVISLILISTIVSAQQKPSQKWIDQKYSMFIHFGLYSAYGGVYEGEPVKRGYSEQIQSFAGIFSDWYGNSANNFNPLNWNPDEIVALANNAGMKSIVLTSKHHDGFCMYHSKYTDFNIVDATPYGKDLMKDLVDACKRGGIDFGVYYSLIDWHYPHGYPISSHNADPLTDEHYQFSLKQVEEIMTNYGEISEIWFDMGSLTPTQSKGLYELVYSLQPNCMISGRLGNDYVDFAVMADNEYPEYKMGIPWQTAASMFDETWGYRSWQERGEVDHKVEEKISSLIKVISRGGNFLLNIGPRGDGSVVEFEKDVLHKIGIWVQQNSEAIYGTNANPFYFSAKWGDITSSSNALYAFITNTPESKKIKIEGFTGKINSVNLLASGENVPFTQNREALEINVSDISSDVLIPVVKISFENGYTIQPETIVTDRVLNSYNTMPLFGHSSLNYYAGYKSLIGYDWALKTAKRSVTPEIEFTDSEIGRKVELQIDNDVHSIILKSDNKETVRTANKSTKWGNTYRKSGRGVFGFVEEEGVAVVDLNATDSRWRQVSDFKYGKVYSEPIIERQSVIFLQEIESLQDNTVAVKIRGGNAMYMLLNGKYITAHFSPERIKDQEEIVLLPLNKGVNQLIVKYYNGFDTELTYSITPLEEWQQYSIKLPSFAIKRNDIHNISLRSDDAISSVSPLRMNNITLKF
jgi:alpha-L-fucosidase